MGEVHYISPEVEHMHESGNVEPLNTLPDDVTAKHYEDPRPYLILDPVVQKLAEDISMLSAMVICSRYEFTGSLPAEYPELREDLSLYGTDFVYNGLRSELQDELLLDSDFTSDDIDLAFEAGKRLCREVTRQSPKDV